MKEYLYETHVHTSPVSKCAAATPEETVTFYREMGYDGLFLTNHFLDGNIGIDYDRPYEEKSSSISRIMKKLCASAGRRISRCFSGWSYPTAGRTF